MDQGTEQAWDVLIKRGYPGRTGAESDPVYPDSAAQVAKLLAEHDLRVAFEDPRADRRYESHHSDEVVIPLLVFAQAIGTNLVASGLYDLLKAYAPVRQPGDRAVKFHVTFYPNGKPKELRTKMRTSDTLEAVRALLEGAEDAPE